MSCTLQNTRQHCARCFLSLGMCRWSLGTCPARCKTQDSTAHAVFCHLACVGGVSGHVLHAAKHKTALRTLFSVTWHVSVESRDMSCTVQNTRQHCARCFLSLCFTLQRSATRPAPIKTQNTCAKLVSTHFAAFRNTPCTAQTAKHLCKTSFQ
jgi:hypothetical protein